MSNEYLDQVLTVENEWLSELIWRTEAMAKGRSIRIANRILDECVVTPKPSPRDETIRRLLPEATRANNAPKWADLDVLSRRAIDRILELESE